MYKTIIYTLVLVFFSGCTAINGGFVKNKDKEIKTIEKITKYTNKISKTQNLSEFYFNFTSKDTLATIIRKIHNKLPNINLYVDPNINTDAKLSGYVNINKINIYDLLKIFNTTYFGPKKFTLTYDNGIYKFQVVKNKEYFKEIEKKKLEKKRNKIIKQVKEVIVSIDKDSTYGDFFEGLYDIYGIQFSYNLTKQIKFLNSKINFNFNGSLYNFLENLKSINKFGIKYSSEDITIYDHVSKVYSLNVPGISNDNTNLKSQKYEIYKKLKEQIENTFKNNEILIGSDSNTTIKENISINDSNKNLTVFMLPSSESKIDSIVKNFNNTYNKVISFHVSFYNVSYTKEQNFGVDITSLIGDLVSRGLAHYNINLDMTGSQVSEISNATHSFSLVNRSGTKKAMLESLNRFGKTSLIQSPYFSSINNVPYFFNIKENTDYVASIKENTIGGTTIQGSGGTTINPASTTKTIEKKSLETGFSLSFLPTIDKNTGDIIFVLNPKIKDLVSLTPYTYESGTADSNGNIPTNTIQLAKTKELNLGNGQMVRIKDGQTAIIGGFLLDKGSDYKDGYPGIGREDSYWDGLFSQKQKTYEKSELIIVITAKIL